MNVSEVAAMVAYLRTAKPAMNLGIPEQTARDWAPLLEPYEAAEARWAVDNLLATTEWFALADIVQAMRRGRRDRLGSAGFNELAPNVDPADVAGYLAEARALKAALASGRMGPDAAKAYAAGELPTLTGRPPHVTAGALIKRDMRALEARRP